MEGGREGRREGEKRACFFKVGSRSRIHSFGSRLTWPPSCCYQMRPSSVFTKLIGMWDSPTWNSDGTYDGQGSGHTMWGTVSANLRLARVFFCHDTMPAQLCPAAPHRPYAQRTTS